MPAPSDEMLMAFVDEELGPAERAAIAALAQRDPEIQRRLQAFQRTGGSLAEVFKQAMQEPVPDRLVSLVMAGPGEPRAARVRHADGLAARLAAIFFPGASAGTLSLRYACILALGIGIGWLLNEGSTEEGDRILELAALGADGIVAGEPMRDALETAAMGGRATLAMTNGHGTTLKPAFSFRDRSGNFCRQYELMFGDSTTHIGVACRGPNGAWRVAAHASANAQRADRSGQIRPAAGAQIPAMVEAAIDRMIDGSVLDEDAEQRLLRSRWQTSP